MSKLDARDHIADGIYARDGSFQAVIYDDAAALHLEFQTFTDETFCIGTASCSTKNVLCLCRLFLILFCEGAKKSRVRLFDLVYHSGNVDIYTALLQDHTDVLGDLLIEVCERSCQRLDDRDLAAQSGQCFCEFRSDNSASDNDEALRHLVHCEKSIACNNALEVCSRDRRKGRYGTCCDDDVVAFDRNRTFFCIYFNHFARHEFACAVVLCNFVCLQQSLYSADKLIYRIFSVCADLTVIKRYVSGMDAYTASFQSVTVYL